MWQKYVETDHQIPKYECIYRIYSLAKIETEEHFIFWFSRYYDIRCTYYYLFRDRGGSLNTFFKFQDQKYFTLFIREMVILRRTLIQSQYSHHST